jgi:hypothetical protein
MSYISVDYIEEPGSPREFISNAGGNHVERWLLCNWEDRHTLVSDALGYRVKRQLYIPNVGFRYWYYPPDLYVAEGNTPMPGLWAYDAQIEPLISTPTTAGLSYKKARINLFYKTMEYEYDETDEVFISERIEPVSEFITVNRSGLYFGTGASATRLDNENVEVPTKINRMMDWVYTIHRVGFIHEAYLNLQGYVNASPVYSKALDLTFPAETLLCGNLSANREILNTGVFHWSVTFRFTYKNNGTFAVPYGWNHFPRTDTAGAAGLVFEKITNASVEVPIYKTADFSTVVR